MKKDAGSRIERIQHFVTNRFSAHRFNNLKIQFTSSRQDRRGSE